MRQWFRDRGIESFWFLEFQKRGAPHFHGVITKGIDENELKREWYKIVGSHDPKHLVHGAHIQAIRSTDGFGHYLTSYLTKEQQKTLMDYFNSLRTHESGEGEK